MGLPDRFWAKVDKQDPSGCWVWTAGTSDGYGWYLISRKVGAMRAHRVAYIDRFGEIPKPLVLDHLCRNRGCVNPDHMEVVTIRENTMRGNGAGARHARKTHCSHGHEFTVENTRITKHGHRVCKQCEYDWQRAYLIRKKESQPSPR